MPALNKFIILLLASTLYVFPALSDDSRINYDECEFEDISELCQYQDAYLDFEEALERYDELEESQLNAQRGTFVGKWCKKAKRWAKKRAVNAIKNLLKVKKCHGPDGMAYTVIHLKKRLARYCKTGTIEDTIKQIEKYTPKEHREKLKPLNDRIIHLWYHPRDNAEANRLNMYVNRTRPSATDELEDIPVAVLVGGLEVCCGAMLYGTGFPPFMAVGHWMVGSGVGIIVGYYAVDYATKLDEENRAKNGR